MTERKTVGVSSNAGASRGMDLCKEFGVGYENLG
jgi:hypothetical protein